MTREGQKTILPYIPPHPARGSGVHRILVTVGTIGKSFPEDQRKCTIAEMLEKTEGKILGFSFFRTCWTKQVTELYKDLGNLAFNTGVIGMREPIYGEVERAYKGPAINALFL